MNDRARDHPAKVFLGLRGPGRPPRRTRRFSPAFTAANRSAAVIARELGLAPHDAESAIEIARKEVAL